MVILVDTCISLNTSHLASSVTFHILWRILQTSTPLWLAAIVCRKDSNSEWIECAIICYVASHACVVWWESRKHDEVPRKNVQHDFVEKMSTRLYFFHKLPQTGQGIIVSGAGVFANLQGKPLDNMYFKSRNGVEGCICHWDFVGKQDLAVHLWGIFIWKCNPFEAQFVILKPIWRSISSVIIIN